MRALQRQPLAPEGRLSRGILKAQVKPHASSGPVVLLQKEAGVRGQAHSVRWGWRRQRAGSSGGGERHRQTATRDAGGALVLRVNSLATRGRPREARRTRGEWHSLAEVRVWRLEVSEEGL